MANCSLLPVPSQQFSDDNGNPLASGKLYFYEVGTTTPKDVYSTSNGNTALSNPVILDSAGRATVWLDGYYKVVLKDANDTQIWSKDNISSQYSQSAPETDQWYARSETPSYISATQFSVTTDLTATYAAGIRIKATVSAGTIYGTITTSAYITVTTVTVLWDSTQLDSGLSAVSLGILTVSNHSIPFHPVVAVTANHTLAITELNHYIHTANAANFNLTLLAANAVPSGSWAHIKNTAAGIVTIVGTINGVANITLANQSDIFIWSDGTNWNRRGDFQIATGLWISAGAKNDQEIPLFATVGDANNGANMRHTMTRAGVVKNLYARILGPQANTGTTGFTLWKNGNATSVTVTGGGSPGTLYSDLANSATFNANDALSFYISGGVAIQTGVSFSVELYLA